jgi:hypothetical protein
MNHVVLVVQLIMLSEDIGSRMTSVGSNNLDKLADLDDSIRRQLMQLHSKFTHDVYKAQMRWHVRPSSEDIFKHDSFIHSRLWHRLRTRRSAISLGKILRVTVHSPKVGFCDSRWPEVIADPIQCSRSYNF